MIVSVIPNEYREPGTAILRFYGASKTYFERDQIISLDAPIDATRREIERKIIDQKWTARDARDLALNKTGKELKELYDRHAGRETQPETVEQIARKFYKSLNSGKGSDALKDRIRRADVITKLVAIRHAAESFIMDIARQEDKERTSAEYTESLRTLASSLLKEAEAIERKNDKSLIGQYARVTALANITKKGE